METRRGFLIKSKGACNSCRARHLKCDETKPSCVRCQKDMRTCPGYQTRQAATSKDRCTEKIPCPVISAALPALPDFDDPLQRDLFGSFVACAANGASVYFGANFWARRVLQLSLSEPAIRYALCSLSALHRMSADPPGKMCYSTANLQQYSLQQYNQAVKHTRKLLLASSDGSEENLVKGLVACALFVCYENFTGNYSVSHMHLYCGFRIIARECCQPRRSAIPKDLIQVFKRLDLQSIVFHDARAPYLSFLDQAQLESLVTHPESDFNFTSVEDSLDVVLRLFRWMLFRPNHLGPCPTSQQDLEFAKEILERWNLQMKHSLTQNGQPDESKHQPPVSTTLLKMYQIISSVIIVTGVQGQEKLHDEYLHKYSEVLSLAETLLFDGNASRPAPSSTRFFCFDIGVIFPLFWISTKCREPYTRRHALKLLSSLHHQEGSWKSTTAAKVAKFVMDIEEESLPGDDGWIPEAARVHLVKMSADGERGEIYVRCVLRSNDNCSWYTRDGRVTDAAEVERCQKGT